MDADGGNVEHLTEGGESQLADSPTWSAGGERIAFTCGSDVCVMNADGSEPKNITNNPDGLNYLPAWSPVP